MVYLAQVPLQKRPNSEVFTKNVSLLLTLYHVSVLAAGVSHVDANLKLEVFTQTFSYISNLMQQIIFLFIM